MIVFRLSPSPTNQKPLPKAPPQPSPKGGSTTKPPKTQQEWTPSPWGGPGRGFSQATVFVPAPAGLFLPPTAAFFTVVIAGVMRDMTVVMAVTRRRKTCFPTVGTTGTTKAKPPAVTTDFCVYFIPMWRQADKKPRWKGHKPWQLLQSCQGRKASHPPTSSQRTSGRRGADSLCCCANTAHCGHRDAG